MGIKAQKDAIYKTRTPNNFINLRILYIYVHYDELDVSLLRDFHCQKIQYVLFLNQMYTNVTLFILALQFIFFKQENTDRRVKRWISVRFHMAPGTHHAGAGPRWQRKKPFPVILHMRKSKNFNMR